MVQIENKGRWQEVVRALCAQSGPCGHKACLLYAGHKACLMSIGKLQLGANGIHTPIRQAGSTTQIPGARHRWWWRPEHQLDMCAEHLDEAAGRLPPHASTQEMESERAYNLQSHNSRLTTQHRASIAAMSAPQDRCSLTGFSSTRNSCTPVCKVTLTWSGAPCQCNHKPEFAAASATALAAAAAAGCALRHVVLLVPVGW